MTILAWVAALMAAFVLLPQADVLSTDWVVRNTVAGHGPEYGDTVRMLWKGLLALLIFAAARAALSLMFSAGSLALLMRILSNHHER